MTLERAAPWIAGGALPLAALLLYWGTLRHPPVFDDASLYLARESSLLRALSTASFAWLDGLPAQRMANIALHGAVGVALYGFLARLFEPSLRWTAFLGALLFVVHPVAVYGVAYLVQRSIVMATLFSLLSLWCVLEGLARRAAPWFAAAAIFYALALLSKEHAVMLPAVALALGFLVRRTARPLLPLLGVLAVIAAIAVYQARTLIGAAYEPFAAEFAAGDRTRLVALSIVNQGALFFRYLLTWLLPLPSWMSADLRVALPDSLLGWQTAAFAGFLGYGAAAAALLARGGRAGLLGFGLLYPWLLFLTELAVVRVQEPFVLYRSYLWMSGLPAILPALAAFLPRRAVIAVLAAACVAMVPVALGRIDTFANSLKLWDDVVRKNEGVSAPYVERGYWNRGDLLRISGQHRAAFADFERAISLNPRSPIGYIGRATVMLDAGRPDLALADLDRALELDPNHAIALGRRCSARLELKRPRAEALADCDRALALRPSHPEVRLIHEMAHRPARGSP